MTHHPEAHRRRTREHLLQMVQLGGPAWHDYAIDQAVRYEKEDPTLHGGLEAEVRRAVKASNPATQRRT